MTIPFALSVSHFISTVGADAGFAAIIGLAILVLLYFAQARETATLREQATHAAEQVQQLEYRLTQLARSGAPAPAGTAAPAPVGQRAGAVPAQPVAAPAAARTIPPGHVPARVAAPAAPAGVGAPALASATRLIPSLDDDAISIRATGGAAGSGAAAGAASGYAAAQGRGGGAAVMSPPGPPPATAAGGANGGSTGRTSPPPVAAGNTAAPRAAGQAPPRQPVRNGAPRPPAPAPRRPVGPPRRSGARGLVLGLAGLLVVAVIVVGLLVLTSGSGSSNSHSSSSTAAISNAPSGKSRHRGARGRTAVKPATVTAAVLNGTSTTNLAHDISVKLGSAGYKLGRIATATDQTQTATVVGYLAGHRAAALIVAKSLGLGPASVQAVGSSNQAVACPQAASCAAQVVVTVGSDLASAASSSSTPGATAAPGQTTTASATT
ncbi:MAG: LytR C-terminal domain-containing protein [Solirubrobacteraceae bacterium]